MLTSSPVSLPPPPGDWALLVALPGQSWPYLPPGGQDTANATSFEADEGDDLVLQFESIGREASENADEDEEDEDE